MPSSHSAPTAPALGEGALRGEQGLAALRAAAAAHLSLAGQLQVATALEMTAALEARLHELRHQLLDAARRLAGARVLAERLYGVGPVTALAMTRWLGNHHVAGAARCPTDLGKAGCSWPRSPGPHG